MTSIGTESRDKVSGRAWSGAHCSVAVAPQARLAGADGGLGAVGYLHAAPADAGVLVGSSIA